MEHPEQKQPQSPGGGIKRISPSSSRVSSLPFVFILLLLAGCAWAELVFQARSMMPMPMAMEISMASFIGMWTVMMAAMMMPSIIPLASRYVRTITTRRIWGLIGLTTGYMGVWVVTGVLAFTLAWSAGQIAMVSPWAAKIVAAAIFAIGGIYQFTPWKEQCLTRCRVPFSLLLRYASWRGINRHLRVGIHHGAFCLGCCWALMVLMLAFGLMNIGATLLLAAIVTLEKAWTHGVLFSRLVGGVCCILALAVLWIPGLAPGLIFPGNGMLMLRL